MRNFAILAAMAVLGGDSAAPPRTIEIVASDYAFMVPAEMAPGPVVFAFNNIGNVRHELNISLLRKGVTPDEYMAMLRSPDKSASTLVEAPVGVLFAKKHARSSAGLETILQAGRDYMIICIFRDSAGAKRHHEMGMYSRIHIRAGISRRKAARQTDTIVGVDYAFLHKMTAKPGPHAFMFINKGAQRHEVSFALLRKGISVDSVVKADKAGENVNKLLEEAPGLLHAPAGIASLGFLRLNLLAGREYMIECAFQDSAKAPPHYELGMYGSLKVALK